MEVPFARFAVDPGKRFLQPGNEVIALRLVAVAPAALDALGPGEQRELRLGDAARRLEQPQRPRAGLPELARVPFARLDAPPGVLGPVVGLCREAADRVAAQARAQPLDEPRPVLLLGGRIAEHGGTALPERREIARFERERFDRSRQCKR